jgi:hypothetical protein
VNAEALLAMALAFAASEIDYHRVGRTDHDLYIRIALATTWLSAYVNGRPDRAREVCDALVDLPRAAGDIRGTNTGERI